LIFILYFLPVFGFSVYSFGLIPNQGRWFSLAIGLCLSAFGTAILFWANSRWQRQVIESAQESFLAPQPKMVRQNHLHSNLEDDPADQLQNLQQIQGYVEEMEIKQNETLAEIQQKEEALQALNQERIQLTAQVTQLQSQLEIIQQQSQDHFSSIEKQQNDYLKTITQQRELIEQQEQHILKAEGQIRDLNYEIKTLIQINELSHKSEDIAKEDELDIPVPLYRSEASHPSAASTTLFQTKPIMPPVVEANLQLKRCIDIAQKITVASPFGGEASRFRDLSLNSYSLDLRRLFDSLRSENSSTIILYSQKEDKLLFANNQTKNLLGWSPEKFVQDFSQLVVEGIEEWSQALNQLPSKNEVQFQLVMKSKSGQDVAVNCHIGSIPTGMFKNHIIGVLY